MLHYGTDLRRSFTRRQHQEGHQASTRRKHEAGASRTNCCCCSFLESLPMYRTYCQAEQSPGRSYSFIVGGVPTDRARKLTSLVSQGLNRPMEAYPPGCWCRDRSQGVEASHVEKVPCGVAEALSGLGRRYSHTTRTMLVHARRRTPAIRIVCPEL